LSAGAIAVHIVSKPEISQGAEFLLQAAERIRVHGLSTCPGKWLRIMPVRPASAGRAKSMTNQLTFIVRVMWW